MRKVKRKTEKIKRFKKSKTSLKEAVLFFRKLQTAVEEPCNDDRIAHGNDSDNLKKNIDFILPHSKKQTLPKGDSTSVRTNIRNGGSAYNNYTCCKDLSEITSTIFPPFYRRVPSFTGQHKFELSFIQAIIWLKSVTTCIPQMPPERLQQLFDKQRNMPNNHNYDKNEHIEDVHVGLSLTSLVNKTLSVHEMNNSEKSILSSLKSIFDSSCNIISPVIYKSYSESEDIQNKTFSFESSLKDRNESIAELSELERVTDYVMTNQEERNALLSKSYITQDSNEDFLLHLNNLFYISDMQEHQSFEYEQMSLKHSNKRVNNEVIEDESDTDISNEHRSVSLARSQSIESIFYYNSDMEYITPIHQTSKCDVSKIRKSDYSVTNFTNYLSNINFSQISSQVSCKTLRGQNNASNLQTNRVQSKTLHDCNDDNFKYQIDDNSPYTSLSDFSTAAEEENRDSTSRIETLNYDTAITTKSSTANKCVSIANIGHHYNLQSPLKKEEISPSLIRKPIRKGRFYVKNRSSPKKRKSQPVKNLTKNNNFQTDRVHSKTSLDCNDDNFKYQIDDNGPYTSLSDFSAAAEEEDHDNTSRIETLNYTAITTKSSTANKCISVANIGQHYNLQSSQKKEETTSPSLVRKPIRKGRFYVKNRSSPKKRKSQPVKNLTKNNNFQTDRVHSKTSLDCNDDNFKYQIDGNSSCTSLNDSSAAEKEDHDSAYSTSKFETLNYDTAITTKFSTANKCVSIANIGHHYNLQSPPKKEETTSPSLIRKPIRKGRFYIKNRSSPKKRKSQPVKNLTKNNNFQTDRVHSKTSHDCNDDNFKYQIDGNSPCTSLNDSNAAEKKDHDSAYSTSKFETLNYETEITKSTTANKCTSIVNIGYHYNLRPRKKKEESVSPSLIQNPVRKGRFSVKKQSSQKKRKSQLVKNIRKNNNFQTDRVQSKTSPDCNDDNFKYQIEDNNLCTSLSDSSAAEREDHDKTWKIETFNYDTAITVKFTTVNKCMSIANIGHRYNLRPRKKKEETVSPSLIQKPIRKRQFSAKKHSSPKKRKSESLKNLTKNNNFQTDRVQSKTSPDCNDDNFKYQIEDNNLCTSLSDSSAVEREDHDKTWKIETFNYDTAITIKFTTVNKCMSIANIEHRYNLRPRKKKEETVSSSLIQKPIRKKQFSAKKQSSSKKRKLPPAENLTKKRKENKDGTISANWLNFTAESELLNSEHVILTSVKVIVSTLCDKRTAQEYAIHKCWKDSLEEQAISTVLNVVDVLRMEKKPDICTKEIEKTIVETLDEMITSVELNETSIWIYRIQIILQFCNLSICIKTINYLIAMLRALQQMLIDAANGIERAVQIEIDQLHLVCYTLDIALRTYRTLVPRDKRSQRAENAIPYVGDLWKVRYRVENVELEDISFDLDATEKQWISVLKTFTETSVKHLVQFTDVSYSLYHDILIST